MEHYLSQLRLTVYVHDYEVAIGPPEHLEPELRAEGKVGRIDRSFEDFVSALQNVAEQRDGRFVTLQSRGTFEVKFVLNNEIEIGKGDARARIDVDDLRSVWVRLLKGVVTQEAVEWGPPIGNEFILSLLSALPDVRPVQIQRRNADPEIAVELRSRRGSAVPHDSAVQAIGRAWA
jgi:hypothetical protein